MVSDRPGTLFERMSKIARGAASREADEPAPDFAPAVPLPPAGPRQPGISEAEAKARNRALRPFVMWLHAGSTTREKLESADAAELAAKYPPLDAADIAQMIRVRMRGLR